MGRDVLTRVGVANVTGTGSASGSWAEAVGKAKAMVANMTLEEKVCVFSPRDAIPTDGS